MGAFDPRSATDGALLVAVGRWQETALSELYQRHAGAVFSLAMRLLCDRGRAEDVTQEIFLRLWNEPTAYDVQRGSLRTFLCTQTHSRAVDIIRSETSRRRREDTESNRVESMIDNLEREVVDLAIAEEVKAALASLPDGEREAIDLAYYRGHSYREVAMLLEEPEGTIKSRIRSGLKRLRETLPASVRET